MRIVTRTTINIGRVSRRVGGHVVRASDTVILICKELPAVVVARRVFTSFRLNAANYPIGVNMIERNTRSLGTLVMFLAISLSRASTAFLFNYI